MSIEDDHQTVVTGTPEGYLPSCKCGWRYQKFVSYQTALLENDKHLVDAKQLRLNRGSRVGTRGALVWFTKNAENPVYSDDERAMWRQLALELEIELKAQKKGPVEGQIALPFD